MDVKRNCSRVQRVPILSKCLPHFRTHLVVLASAKSTICLKFQIDLMFSVEAEWSPSGDVGDGADEDVLDAVFQWLWVWWWQLSIQARQVQEFGESSIHSAVLGVLVLASDTVWMATITDWSLGPSSAQKAHWTWVCWFSKLAVVEVTIKSLLRHATSIMRKK